VGPNPDFGVDFVKMIWKILFWISVVFLAFIPGGIYMSFVLLIFYYGSKFLKSLASEFFNSNWELYIKNETETVDVSVSDEFEEDAKYYSNDTLEEMK